MLEMDPGIRARWTAALRSGQYVQGYGQLRQGGGHCCLGVLCDLAAKSGVISWDDIGPGSGFLPGKVVDWAGLAGENARDPILAHFPDDEGADEDAAAASLNDDHFSFAQIADLIDGGDRS
jgi:hypothetical protein